MLTELFNTEGLAPHGFCLLWRPELFWSLAVSDGLIALSYVSISGTIAVFLIKRKDMYLRWVGVAFALFILLCAASHATDLWTLWLPDYGVQILAKAATAVISVATAILLWPLLPRALSLPSIEQMAAVNSALRFSQDGLERTVEDRTRELRESEKQLHDSNALFQAILNSLDEGLHGLNEDGKIIFENKAATAMLGWDLQEMLGQPAHSLMHHTRHDASVYEQAECPIYATLKDGVTRNVSDEVFWRKNGSNFPVDYTSIALRNGEGKIIGTIVAFRDISDRKSLVRSLQKSNVELEQFAYVASHDLRQPLRMVTSYLSVIEKRLGPQLDEELRTYFAFATDGARKMDRLITDLLEYSRTGRLGEIEPGPLCNAVADSLLILKEAIDQAGAKISVEEKMPTITANRTELVRLFQNLITNSIKYRSPDRPPDVKIGWRRQGNEYLVWIKDNGMGIAPEQHERAFLIFQRLVPKEAYEGTGIGLAICKKIVEQTGGKIWIESEVGQGCTFFMTFPASSKAGQTTTEANTNLR